MLWCYKTVKRKIHQSFINGLYRLIPVIRTNSRLYTNRNYLLRNRFEYDEQNEIDKFRIPNFFRSRLFHYYCYCLFDYFYIYLDEYINQYTLSVHLLLTSSRSDCLPYSKWNMDVHMHNCTYTVHIPPTNYWLKLNRQPEF